MSRGDAGVFKTHHSKILAIKEKLFHLRGVAGMRDEKIFILEKKKLLKKSACGVAGLLKNSHIIKYTAQFVGFAEMREFFKPTIQKYC